MIPQSFGLAGELMGCALIVAELLYRLARRSRPRFPLGLFGLVLLILSGILSLHGIGLE